MGGARQRRGANQPEMPLPDTGEQIYISSQAWDAIRNSKEETIKAINIASIKVPDDASGLDLCNVIFDLIQKVEKMPYDVALEIVKEEARQIM